MKVRRNELVENFQHRHPATAGHVPKTINGKTNCDVNCKEQANRRICTANGDEAAIISKEKMGAVTCSSHGKHANGGTEWLG